MTKCAGLNGLFEEKIKYIRMLKRTARRTIISSRAEMIDFMSSITVKYDNSRLKIKQKQL